MPTQSDSFTAVGGGTSFFIKLGKSLTYTLSGGATATLNLERSVSAGATWEVLETTSGDTGPTTIENTGNSDALYRWNCTAYTSGTAVGAIKDATEELLGVGSVPVTTVTPYEYGDGVARKTVLQCNALVIAISDDAGVAQYGGVKVYDFPEGMLLIKGVQINGILTAETPIINNWDGDVAAGTAIATTGATLTGTEADVMPSVAVSAGASDKDGVVDAVSVATALTESGARWLDGTATAKDLFLNFVIDDNIAHAAGNATFNGTIEFNWEMMGNN